MNDFIDYVVPSFDEIFMREVYLIATKSKDLKTKIGAVLVRDNHSLLRGYNGIAKGVKDLPERMERPEKYDWMVHAESNVCFMGAKFGISTDKSILYTCGIPCVQCSDAVINSGIKEVVIHKQWQDAALMNNKNQRPWVEIYWKSKVKLDEANISIKVYDKFLNVDAYWDGKTFKV